MKLSKELLPFVAQIRHEFTNYDKLTSYYAQFREERGNLNRVISDLIGGLIDIPEFHERVKEIEERVDLTRKRNQKKYLKKQQKLLQRQKCYTQSQIHEISKRNLQNVLNLQKAQDNDVYRPDLNIWQSYRWKR